MSRETKDAMVFDEAQALEYAGGDRDLLCEIARMYLSDIASRLDGIQAVARAGDTTAVERAAHKLRGSLGALAAHRATSAAQLLESIAAEKDPATISAPLDSLVLEASRLKPVLEELLRRADVAP